MYCIGADTDFFFINQYSFVIQNILGAVHSRKYFHSFIWGKHVIADSVYALLLCVMFLSFFSGRNANFSALKARPLCQAVRLHLVCFRKRAKGIKRNMVVPAPRGQGPEALMQTSTYVHGKAISYWITCLENNEDW